MSPKFVPFELERWQSTWENRVRFNLSESGVHPLSIQELLGLAAASAVPLLEVRLGYAQSNGSDLLRERIAALYRGASLDQVLVTTGSSEANFVTCWRLLEPGDKVAVMMPNYLQTWGLAQNFGAQAKAFQLHEKEGWEPYAEEIRTAIAPGTKLVVVTNPHNPTGHVLGDAVAARRSSIAPRKWARGSWRTRCTRARSATARRRSRSGARGTTSWIIVNGLSKAYGLPGLRIGWIVSTAAFGQEAWARHDYTTIGPSGVGITSARSLWTRMCARSSSTAPGAFCTRLSRDGNVLKAFGDTFTWHAPHAGAICWARYRGAIPALEVVEKLRAQHSVLLCPGDHFGMPGFLRFGYGGDLKHLQEALAETERGLRRLFSD